jgi:type IV pilus assembly protein PilM
MAFIDSFTSLINSFFSKKDSMRIAVGIDIGSSSIKIVQLSLKNGKINLDTYGSIALGPYNNLPVGVGTSPAPEKMAEALKELIKECAVDVNRIGVALPTSSSLFRDISIPSGITDSEMKTVVITEARRVIPVPVSDVDIDWLPVPDEILPEDAKSLDKKHLLLVAVSHESQKRVESYFSAASIMPLMYELEVFSSMRSIYTHERAPIVLVDLGASHIKVSIIHEGSMRRAVSIDRGFNELDNALVASGLDFKTARTIKHSSDINAIGENETIMKNAYLSILKDVQAVISEYEKYSHSSCARIILLGGGAEMMGVTTLTQNTLGVTTENSQPFARATVPELVKDIIPKIEPEFTIATGLAMRLLMI